MPVNDIIKSESTSELSQSELKALGPRPIGREAARALIELLQEKANQLDVDEPPLVM